MSIILSPIHSSIVVAPGGAVSVRDFGDRPHELALTRADGVRIACTLRGDWFVFSGGPHGEHQIAAEGSITTAVRLIAHWKGYASNAGFAWVAAGIAVERSRLESLVWTHTHADFRDIRDDGTRVVLINRPRYGTCSEALSQLSEADLIDKLPRALREQILIIPGPAPE